MNEVEVKFLEIDKNKIVKKLLSLGAKKVFDGVVAFSFFDSPSVDLKSKGSILRLRKKGEEVELCFKKSVKSSFAKSVIETEVLVSDYEKMKTRLLSLGLIEAKKHSKHRVSYKLGNLHFEIDTFTQFPAYLEIEAHSEKELRKAVEQVGLDIKDAKPWGMGNVFKHYNKKY